MFIIIAENKLIDRAPVVRSAPCERRPRDIKNGIVRYNDQKHGKRAIYECEFGFYMVGENYLLCQYGNWINPSGVETKCQPS